MRLETKKIKVIVEHRNYLPTLTAEERKNLENSIREHGIQSPLILMKGTTFLLDGHNRLEVAKKLNIKVVPVEVQATNNAEEWILRNQLSRRNLSELNRDKLMTALYKKIKEKSGVDKEKKEEDIKALAKAAKVSKSTLNRVVKQQEEIAALPAEVQEKVAEAGTRREAAKIIQNVNPQSSTVKLKNDILNYRNAFIGIIDGAEALEEDGLKDFNKMFLAAVNLKKAQKLIEHLESEAKKLKEERKKELEPLKKK